MFGLCYHMRLFNFLFLNMHPKRYPQTTNAEPKGCQSEPRNLQKHDLCNRIEKGSEKYVIYKIPMPKIIKQTIANKLLNSMPKGCQNGANIDDTTHQKTMPKLVL